MTKLHNRTKLFLLLLLMVVSLSGLSACVQSENPHTAEPRTYTVRFMVDGEEYAKKSADWDKAITFPEVPQKKGYTLDGWYDGDTKVSEITQGYKDFVTLVARWKTVDYVITYELGGGKNNEANPTSYTVESESVSLAQPLKYGYAFKGWYYDGQQIDSVNPAWSRNVTLTAKWQIDPDSTCFTYGDNYTITGLKDNSVKDIFIPDYVTAIAAEAFLMTEIQSLQFAEDSACTSVGEYAFEGCEKLITVKIPASIESVGICTFYMCTSLQTLEFAENSKLERIPGGMLNDCYALTSLRLPSGITEIEDAAIAGCTSLEEVTFAQDSKLQRIGDYNFIQCKSLKSIVIPRNVSYIGQAAEYTLDEIYYIGDANEWSAIAGASSFTRDATVYYYSANQPAQAGNYWHYNGQTIVKW